MHSESPKLSLGHGVAKGGSPPRGYGVHVFYFDWGATATRTKDYNGLFSVESEEPYE